MRARSGARRWLVRFAGYALAATVLTWPLVPQALSHLGALQGPGDPYFQLWVLGWNLHTLSVDPRALVDGRIFDANIFHPAAGTLAYSDHLLLQSAALLPLYRLTGDVVLCYNVLLLVSFVASGLTMHAYARAVTGSESAAWVAGLVWAFFPYRVSHLIHLQLQALYFLPLALLFLHRTIAGRRWRDAAALGVFAGLQAVSVWNYGVVTIVALAAAGVSLAVAVGRWRSAPLVARAVAAALAGTVVVAPFAVPYWRAQQREGFARNLYEASQHAARPMSYLQVPPDNQVYGRTHLLTARDADGRLRPGRREGVEHALFPGFVLLALASAGVWRGRRAANRPVVWAMLCMAAAGFVFSLGPDGVRWLYAAAYHHVFGFHSLRAPARFAVLVIGGLGVLAAMAVASVPQRRRRTAALLASALILLEYASAPLPWVQRPPARTDVGQWLARADGPGAVIHLPLTLDERNTPPMVQSLEHWRPIVNGHSGQRPPFFTALVDVMSDFPTADALWTLRDLDVRFVVSPAPLGGVPHPDTGEPLAPGETPLTERTRTGDAVIYELVWSEAHDARMPRPAPEPPPPPDAPPFAIGERATYDVRWLGGGLGMSAGRATIEVRSGEHSGPYRFVARAETADWVRQFFDARNEYATLASADLLPLRQTRDEQQGYRRTRREFAFDHDQRVVHLASAPGAAPDVTLPIPPGTRDALTALYYLRSRSWTPGDVVRLPLNDGGRNLVLEVRAAGEETVDVEGRSLRAIRLESRVVQRVARRQPVELTVWLALDAARLPLRADVNAGFGRVRLDLQAAPTP